jgi:hypothetical protein
MLAPGLSFDEGIVCVRDRIDSNSNNLEDSEGEEYTPNNMPSSQRVVSNGGPVSSEGLLFDIEMDMQVDEETKKPTQTPIRKTGQGIKPQHKKSGFAY